MQINSISVPQRKHTPQQNFGAITYTFVKPPIAKAAQEPLKYYTKSVQAFKEFFKGGLTQGMFTQQLVDNSSQFGTKEEAKALIEARKKIANSPFKHSVKVSATKNNPLTNFKKISETFHPDGSATITGKVHDSKGLSAEFQKTIHPDRSSDLTYNIANKIIGQAKSKPDGSKITREKYTTDDSIWITEMNHHKGTKKITTQRTCKSGNPIKQVKTLRPDGSKEEILLYNGKKADKIITTADGFETKTSFDENGNPLNQTTKNPDKKVVNNILYNSPGNKMVEISHYPDKSYKMTDFQPDRKTPAKERSYYPDKSYKMTDFHSDGKTPAQIKYSDPEGNSISAKSYNVHGKKPIKN